MDNHKRMPWHSQKIEEVLSALETSEEGLSDAEAAERLRKDGPNTLRSKPPKKISQMLKEQLLDPMVLILIGASFFSAVLREWTEAAVLGTIIVINAVIGIFQERKAQASLEALKNMGAQVSRVMREGEESVISAGELVVDVYKRQPV